MNIPRDVRLSLIILFALIMSGCATPQPAKNLASHTLSDLAVYQSQISAKVTAEQTFYRKQAEVLRKYLVGMTSLDPADMDDAGKIKRSLLYGRIVTSANYDARVRAEAIALDRNPKYMTEILEFARSGVESDLADFRELSERRARLRQELLGELAKIDQQRNRLNKVQAGLQKLTKDDTGTSRLRLYLEHAEVIRAALESFQDASPGS